MFFIAFIYRILIVDWRRLLEQHFTILARLFSNANLRPCISPINITLPFPQIKFRQKTPLREDKPRGLGSEIYSIWTEHRHVYDFCFFLYSQSPCISWTHSKVCFLLDTVYKCWGLVCLIYFNWKRFLNLNRNRYLLVTLLLPDSTWIICFHFVAILLAFQKRLQTQGHLTAVDQSFWPKHSQITLQFRQIFQSKALPVRRNIISAMTLLCW